MGRSQPQPCRADPSQRGESLPRPSPFNPPGTRGSHRHKAHRARPEGEGPPPRPHPGPSRLPGIPPPPHSAQHPRLSPHCEIHCSKKHGPELLLPRGSWPPPYPGPSHQLEGCWSKAELLWWESSPLPTHQRPRQLRAAPASGFLGPPGTHHAQQPSKCWVPISGVPPVT